MSVKISAPIGLVAEKADYCDRSLEGQPKAESAAVPIPGMVLNPTRATAQNTEATTSNSAIKGKLFRTFAFMIDDPNLYRHA